jgi:agmatine deiminase
VALVGGSIYESDDDRTYNTSTVFSDKGKMLGKYRKTHIPQDQYYFEKEYFEPGDTGFAVFETDQARIASLICYDQWYPEAARCCALLGADVIFYPTAIGTVRGIQQTEGNWHRAWENVMRGHAIANSLVIAAVNRAGTEDRMRFWGGSFVIDAFGKTLRRAGSKEGVVICDIDLDHGQEVREGWRFFRNRRPECYGQIVEPLRK